MRTPESTEKFESYCLENCHELRRISEIALERTQGNSVSVWLIANCYLLIAASWLNANCSSSTSLRASKSGALFWEKRKGGWLRGPLFFLPFPRLLGLPVRQTARPVPENSCRR